MRRFRSVAFSGKGWPRHLLLWLVALFLLLAGGTAGRAAPYAALVMDARTGEVLYARNADTRLYPASLTKMMTLYLTFQAVERGEISLDTRVRISRKAASQPPSRLGLRAGQRVAIRDLIRAAALKSANDAAMALAEAVGGSEARFVARMNATAREMGMTRTTFRNPHGLTERGHLSTARDMTILGRHLIYDFPQYYHLFSRTSHVAAGKRIRSTNRKFLASYRGADGIKTGYTAAAGFNLTASARRGSKRIIATIFGGRSVQERNRKMAQLLDLGFRRAPADAPLIKPVPAGEKGRMLLALAPKSSPRPQSRPVPAEAVAAAVVADIDRAVTRATRNEARQAMPGPEPAPARVPGLRLTPLEDGRVIVAREAGGGKGDWGIHLGRFGNRIEAEKILIRTAIWEGRLLDEARRRIRLRAGKFEADFVGLSREDAALACARLAARRMNCQPLGPDLAAN